MLQTKAIFHRKEVAFEPKDCIVDNVIRLSGAEFDFFSRNLMRSWSFLRNNSIEDIIDKEGRYHCLLVIGNERRDGILVNTEGADYARYSAFIPNVESFLTVGRYPALAALNKKLTAIVDVITEQAGAGSSEGRGVVNLQDWGEMFGIDLMTNGTLRQTVLEMLDERPEIKEWELDKDELIIYTEPKSANIVDSKMLLCIESTTMECGGPDGKPSVMDQIKSARQAPRQPVKDAPSKHKDKGGPEL